MKYSIYKKLGEDEFEKMKNILNSIERITSPFMQLNSFFLNRDSHYEDYLGLDYLHDDLKFKGNIGVRYDEENSSKSLKLFEFYILKAFDKEKKRFFKRVKLEEHYVIEQLQEIAIVKFEECILLYNSLNDEDLNEIINLR